MANGENEKKTVSEAIQILRDAGRDDARIRRSLSQHPRFQGVFQQANERGFSLDQISQFEGALQQSFTTERIVSAPKRIATAAFEGVKSAIDIPGDIGRVKDFFTQGPVEGEFTTERFNLQNNPEVVASMLNLLTLGLPVGKGIGALLKGSGAKEAGSLAARQAGVELTAGGVAGGAAGGVQEATESAGASLLAGIAGGGIAGAGLAGGVKGQRAPGAVQGFEDVEFAPGQLAKPGSKLSREFTDVSQTVPGKAKASQFFETQREQAREATAGALEKSDAASLTAGEVRAGTRFDIDPVTAGEISEGVSVVRREVGGKIGAVRDQVFEQIPIRSKIGSDIREKIAASLSEKFDVKKNILSKVRVSETDLAGSKLDLAVFKRIKQVSEGVAKSKTLKAAQNELDKFTRINQRMFRAENLDKEDMFALREIRRKIKSGINEAIEDVDPALAKTARDADAAFAKIAEPLETLESFAVSAKGVVRDTDALTKSFFASREKNNIVKAFKTVAENSPEGKDVLGRFRQGVIHKMFRTADVGPEGINAKKLDAAWDQLREVRKDLFTPEQVKAIEKTIEIWDKVGPVKLQNVTGLKGQFAGLGNQIGKLGRSFGIIESATDFFTGSQKAAQVFRPSTSGIPTGRIEALSVGAFRGARESQRQAKIQENLKRFLQLDPNEVLASKKAQEKARALLLQLEGEN